MREAIYIVIGGAGQALFAARILLQWRASERAGRPVVPPRYWEISLLAGALVVLYGALRRDPVYLLGALPGLVTSARNLIVRAPTAPRTLLPWALLLATLSLATVLLAPHPGTRFWAIVGTIGAALWAGRILAQWWSSERAGISQLPPAFWILSLAGGLVLAAYALSRRDPVMIAGYAFGTIPYARNLTLQRRSASRPPHSPRS